VTLVVPSSTQFVPDGTNIPPNVVWRANSQIASLQLVTRFASAQQASGFPGVDFDINFRDATNNNLIAQRNSFWTETNVVDTRTFSNFQVAVELEGGGTPVGTHQGTVFGFSLEANDASTIFGASDRQILVDVERKLDRRPYQLVMTHTGVNSNRQIDLQPGVTAVSWIFRQVPPGIDITDGLPPYYFRLGFVTPLTPQGYTRSRRIVFQNQLFELEPAVTAIALTIRSGLVIDVSEYLVPFS